MRTMLNCILKKAQDTGVVAIVGAGKKGKELLMHLENNNSISIVAFFDNNEKLTGKSINNIKIVKPYKVQESNCLYIIAVEAKKRREELRFQLLELGINAENILDYYDYRDYDYLSTLDEKYYQEEISGMYYERFGKPINWQSPSTYNEIINWEKINVKDERRTRLSDKYLVKEWVKGKIGESHLAKLYGVWDDADDINFDSLPHAFVLKVNNGSARNIVVKEKTEINQAEVREQLNAWKKNNFAYASLELHYKDIVPKIICEEYLEGVADEVYDYNIYCFHGEPMYIWCIKGSHKPDCKASFYSQDWEMLPFSYGYPKDTDLAPRPQNLDEMLKLSRILSQDFEHVRVDWYNLPNGRVIFGEMSFSTWSGRCHFIPEEYDAIFGNLI